MPGIAEKLEFIREQTVKVYSKSRYWKKGRIAKNVLLSKFLQKLPRKSQFLILQGDFFRIIDVVKRRVCFFNRLNGKSQIRLAQQNS